MMILKINYYYSQKKAPNLSLKKKKNFAQKNARRIRKTDEKDKYEYICDVFSSTLTNKSFYSLFINNNKLVELLFSLKSTLNPKKLIININLLNKS